TERTMRNSNEMLPALKDRRTLSVRKMILFNTIFVSMIVIFLEASTRTYFAIRVGPDVFLYGTPLSKRQEQFDPKGMRERRASDESSVAYHDNLNAGYSKYYPHQKRNDRDEFDGAIDVTINEKGFRGRDFAMMKQPGVVRVVTLGASSTFGFKDHDNQTYP